MVRHCSYLGPAVGRGDSSVSVRHQCNHLAAVGTAFTKGGSHSVHVGAEGSMERIRCVSPAEGGGGGELTVDEAVHGHETHG